jgi:hypothetical protein
MLGVNEPRVKLWIQALRSGEYTQCEGVLERHALGKTSHCCLGVAQRVALANGYTDGTNNTEDNLPWGSDGMDYGVASWYGFDSETGDSDPDLGIFPEIDAPSKTVSCVRANDELLWNFAQIADALEARYITPKNIEREA